jgi:hypothetical protein
VGGHPFSFPEMIAQHIPRNMVHPGPELPIARKSMARFQHAIKHRLYHIFTYLPLPGHMKKEPIQGPMVPVKQQRHFIQIPGFHF